MAPEPTTTFDSPGLADLAKAIVDEYLSPQVQEKLRKSEQETHLARAKDSSELGWSTLGTSVEKIATEIIEWTSLPPVIGDGLARAAMNTLLGDGLRTGGATSDIGHRLVSKIAGPGGPVEPGTGGAGAYLGLLLSEQIEAWARGVFVELVSGLAPAILGVAGGVESFAKLQDIVETALGGGRMVRRVLMPFINATAILPAQWHVNKQYRPELLSAGALIEQFFRDPATRAALDEELARQGWSAERIATLVENARKHLSDSDAEVLYESGQWQGGQLTDHYKRQGMTEEDAQTHFTAVTARLSRGVQDKVDAAAIAAYAEGLVNDAELASLTANNYRNASELAKVRLLAELRRRFNVRRLPASRVRALVKEDIATMADYRRALAGEGYPLEDITLEEVSLRLEMKTARDVAEARRQERAERDAERAAAATAKEARQAELAEAKRLPSRAEFARAYVRGFIDRDRLAFAVRAEHPGITDSPSPTRTTKRHSW